MIHNFFLKWNFFNQAVSSTLQEEGTTNQFGDVTLVSDELIPFKVNKFVLSAISPVMKETLFNHPQDDPLIYLNGYNKHEVKSVIELIYFGETILHSEGIQRLVKIIEDFQLTGFEIPIKTLINRRNRATKKCKGRVPRKSEDVESFGGPPENKKDGKYECNYCDYKSNHSGHVRIHQESKHEGVRHECDLCDYKATTNSHLRRHQRKMHTCNQCDLKAGLKSQIVEHQRRHHNM